MKAQLKKELIAVIIIILFMLGLMYMFTRAVNKHELRVKKEVTTIDTNIQENNNWQIIDDSVRIKVSGTYSVSY